jgi:four helix bundle protein
MRDFKTLEVWQIAHQLTLGVYRATKAFPREEIYGITSQMRRACSSIPANLAEGFSKHGNVERAHFVNIAIGSAGELEYFLLLAHDLELLPASQYETLQAQVSSVERMLSALYRKIKSDVPTR